MRAVFRQLTLRLSKGFQRAQARGRGINPAEPGGRVTYPPRKPWSDGTHTLDFDPLAFLERLAALVPPPRANRVTYHGVFAPNHTLRDTVVRQAGRPPYPFPPYRRRPPGERRHPDPTLRPQRYRWAE